MRKRKKNLFRKNQKYGILWFFLIVCLLISSVFTFSFPWRGIFQDFSVSIGKLFTRTKIDLERYDRELIESLREENEQLRNLLGYKESLEDYEMIPSTVIYREKSWDETLIINCGKKEGVEVNMAVVTEHGLIGKIEEVYEHSSLVRLLIDSINEIKVAVSITSNNQEIHGILDGYDQQSNTFLVTSIQNIETLELGSTVITNGLGNLFPSGIMVGTVSEVTTDTLGVSLVVKVDSKVDFNSLGYVFVLGKENKK